ncbi:hypothetical protein [Bradyrhizobium brasilense]|uniref:hypothetical protein n=1 Tax=Bradyrhizobium brasilense TaxID=1419277 RepID=UPI00322173CB
MAQHAGFSSARRMNAAFAKLYGRSAASQAANRRDTINPDGDRQWPRATAPSVRNRSLR